MKKKIKFLGYALVVVIVLLQLFPSDKPMVSAENPDDLFVTNEVPENIASMLKSACYDCHSNESKFPWYSNIAPVKWLVYDDINHAREELNFSEWNTIKKSDKGELLDDISTVISEGEMPLEKYVLLHSEAKLSEEDREAIVNWADEMLDSLYD